MFVTNIVASAELGVDINLKEATQKLGSSVYNPHTFSALWLRQRNPRTTGQIFKDGKIKCFGAKTEIDSERGIRRFARRIQKKVNPNVKFSKYKIVNMTGTFNMGERICIQLLHTAYSRTSSYYLSHVLHLKMYGVMFCIFLSGRVNILGLKSEKEFRQCVKLMSRILLNYTESEVWKLH